MLRWFPLVVTIACLANAARAQPVAEYDVVIYGGTASGAAAAIQTARMGRTAIIIEPSNHLGGLTSGGLGWTDSGNKNVIGGISREFYQRVKKHYDKPEAWTFDTAATYKFYRKDEDAMWTFEPRIAEMILRQMCEEAKVPVIYGERIDRTPLEAGSKRVKGVTMNGQRVTGITLESGKTVAGKVFIDATYEGDLMAGAGVSYTFGRESNKKYGETWNGVQKAKNQWTHRFLKPVDGYVKPGDPTSGLLHGIDPGPYPADDEGDHRVQAYCFRMCMSLDPKNLVPFRKPADYDESKYELLFRNYEAGDMRLPLKPDMMPNGKTDTNNNCAVSTDYIGQNYLYPDASYAQREKIIASHRSYQEGLMWTLANHPRVPEQIRKNMAKWGLAKDEFTDNGHWPHQIYVREARRMVSDYVMTELDCRRQRQTPQSVGMGSYNMDSHNCMRWVNEKGHVQNEGDIQVSPGGAYMISYLSMVPKKGEASNLIVPVALSSSHISYGSIRMEPVFMVLGQSSATAAVFAIEEKIDVQSVDYAKLRPRLLKDGQVLESAGGSPSRPGAAGIDPAKLKGLVIDDEHAKQTGEWSASSSVGGYVGNAYLHDGNEKKGERSIAFTAEIKHAGVYDVRIAYTANANRATNVPVTIETRAGPVTVKVNQKKQPAIEGAWHSLGRHELPAGKVTITISNKDTDGHVIADAVQLIEEK